MQRTLHLINSLQWLVIQFVWMEEPVGLTLPMFTVSAPLGIQDPTVRKEVLLTLLHSTISGPCNEHCISLKSLQWLVIQFVWMEEPVRLTLRFPLPTVFAQNGTTDLTVKTEVNQPGTQIQHIVAKTCQSAHCSDLHSGLCKWWYMSFVVLEHLLWLSQGVHWILLSKERYNI